MAKKLKCWRKTRDDEFARVHLNKNKKIGVSVESPLKSTLKHDFVVYFGNVERASAKEFKTKSQANKFAKSYMKKHDKC